MSLSTTALAVLAIVVGAALFASLLSDLVMAILAYSTLSAALAVYFYIAGAPFAAIFEAIVAAGLIPALFLFIVSLTETSVAERISGTKLSVVSMAIVGMVVVVSSLFAWVISFDAAGAAAFTESFGTSLWVGRSIDLLAVMMLVFVGVLAVIRLTGVRLEALEETPDVVETPEDADTDRTEGAL